MKKFVVLILLFFLAIIGSEQIIQKNDASKYRIIPKQEKWGNTEIIVENNVHPYLSFIPEAILKPGTPILVEKTKKTLKLKPIFKKLVKVTKKKIVYDDLNKRIILIESNKQKEERSYLILFVLISFICMIISNILFKRSKSFIFSATMLAVAADVFAACIAITAIYFISTFVFGFATLAAFFAILIADLTYYYKSYNVYSAAYYILITISFILLFI